MKTELLIKTVIPEQQLSNTTSKLNFNYCFNVFDNQMEAGTSVYLQL